VVVVAKLQESSTGELGAVVGDDGVGNPEPMDDIRKE
jgi:hypothetical protein